eukprot:TRINITY_DN13143_c0_g1_i1.p1 TRINITY_DN13143_c0_g1~~TRINITY_DN13143_c0_g1_i1.p1  ORF type:complete len:104 (-),score=3.70 TRINITY_DN13143_c0_g1_i1:380-691(-)
MSDNYSNDVKYNPYASHVNVEKEISRDPQSFFYGHSYSRDPQQGCYNINDIGEQISSNSFPLDSEITQMQYRDRNPNLYSQELRAKWELKHYSMPKTKLFSQN